MPLAEWLSNLREKRMKVHVQDSASVEAFLEQFKLQQNEHSIDTTDIRKRSSKIKGILDSIQNPPNNMQFALAQAAAALLSKYQRQIYVIPCGRDKSRVASALALLLLTHYSGTKCVHIVYLNKVLLRKD